MTRSNERWLAVRFAYALVFLVPMQLAVAAGPVYKQEGERGTVYSDRPAHLGATPIRNRVAPSLGPAGYDAAVLRAETDLLALERRYAENRVPRRIAIYDPPRGGVQQAPQSGAPYDLRRRWDPNLPVSPAPSLERNYYYSGR